MEILIYAFSALIAITFWPAMFMDDVTDLPDWDTLEPDEDDFE